MQRRRFRDAVRRPLVVLVGVLAGATVAAAGLAGPAVARPGSGSAPTSGYVALGDSYAAGEGLAPYESGTAGGCDRSVAQSYPALLAERGHRFRPAVSVACSGAVTSDLVASRPGSTVPPQLAAVSSRTRTITVTIGGNDAGFAVIVGDCVYSPVPAVQAALPGRGPGCAARDDVLTRTRIAALSGAPGAPVVPGVVPLPLLLGRIQAAAPRATIYLTGYPLLFGTRTTDAYGCRVNAALPLYVAPDDAAWIRRTAGALNDTIEAAADQARAGGADVHYVDVARAFRGHELCDRKASWLNGVVLSSTTPPQLSPATLHPTARGQQAYASAVRATDDRRCRSHRMVATV